MADKCFHGVPHDQYCLFCEIIQHQAVRHPDSHLRRIAQRRWHQLRKLQVLNRRVFNNGIRGVEDAQSTD